MPIPPIGLAFAYTRGGRARYTVVTTKTGHIKLVQHKSEGLKPRNPLICNECGHEYKRKKSGRCGTCHSQEFVFQRDDGSWVYFDFHDSFSRTIKEGTPKATR